MAILVQRMFCHDRPLYFLQTLRVVFSVRHKLPDMGWHWSGAVVYRLAVLPLIFQTVPLWSLYSYSAGVYL